MLNGFRKNNHREGGGKSLGQREICTRKRNARLVLLSTSRPETATSRSKEYKNQKGEAESSTKIVRPRTIEHARAKLRKKRPGVGNRSRINREGWPITGTEPQQTSKEKNSTLKQELLRDGNAVRQLHGKNEEEGHRAAAPDSCQECANGTKSIQ